MIFRFVISIVLYLFVSQTMFSQESVGLIYGKYNGINASKINPSYLLRSDNTWEIQIAGGHLFFDNNYAGIYKTNMIDVIQNIENLNIPDRAYDDAIDAQTLDVIFNSKNQKTYFDFKTEVLGPGGYLKINENQTIGISSKLRSYAAGRDIPSSLNYHNIIELPTDSIFELNPFQTNGLIWSEYAIHYAQQISSNISMGASIKYNNGYKAFSIDNNISIDYVERGDTLRALDVGQTRFSYSELEDEEIDVVGSGLGFDLGFNMKNIDGSFLGISILDLGWVKMNGKDYLVDYDTNQSIIYSDYNFVNSIDRQISQMLVDGFQIDSSDSYTLFLPTALSFQYQKNINDKWSIEGHWVQNLKFSDAQMRRSNSIAISGVFETKNFSAFLPITIYDYSDIRIGAALRFAYLTIGSDRITSFFGSHENFNGSDFYINLKFYPFNLSFKKKEKINCYGF